MKYIKSLAALIFAIFIPVSVFAQEAIPANPSERIMWAVKNSGPMPKPMIIGLVLLFAMIIITVMFYVMKGDDRR